MRAMSTRRLVLCVVMLAICGHSAAAKQEPRTSAGPVRFAPIFGDHAVLQCESWLKPVKIWGLAPARTRVTVMLTESEAEADALAGRAALERPAPPPSEKGKEPPNNVIAVYERPRPIEFRTITKKAMVDEKGMWSVTLDPLKASFTPKFLVVAGWASSI